MSQRAGRRAQPGTSETPWMIAAGALCFALLLALLWWGASLADSTVRAAAGRHDPVNLIVGQITGAVPVTGLVLGLFAAGLILILGVGLLIAVTALKQRKSRTRVDSLAKSMARAKDFKPLGHEAMSADAERLGASTAGPGVPLGRLVNNDEQLRGSWEWVQTWIMGPRAGKTSCVCVPQIIETNGPVVTTSNKRDIVDLTRGPRSVKGVVWIQDVQDIIGESASWWWNPLSFVEDMETAEKLADVFISSATSAGSKQDAYFESDGKRLLSHMFMAAAVDGRPITDVFRWSMDPDDKTPVNALHQCGHLELAEALSKIQGLTPKQRDGVYGTMRPWISVLGNERVVPWIRDTGAIGRPEFDHRGFAHTTDTIYLISREGGGSARAITAALAMAILTAAEKDAGRRKGGRLSPPLMAVLDEAANVVRWRELPDLYSHYGSRGIVVSTFFQSFVQGVEAFGKEGMRKLWSSANVRVAGSGLSEDEYLPFVSQLVGERDVTKRTASNTKGGRQVSTSVQRERILDVSDIAALPRSRALLFSSGYPAALLALEHFSAKPYAENVRDSEDFYAPASDAPAAS